jgi:serine/threonine protein kinase
MYLAPEIVARDEAFDGFAIDLWASGVVLFVLLVGLAPFKWAHSSDKRYAKICKGNLREMMHGLNIPISDEACDLLQNMFWRDPAQRLTLAQVEQHPWVRNKKFATRPQAKVSPLHPAMMLRGVAPV